MAGSSQDRYDDGNNAVPDNYKSRFLYCHVVIHRATVMGIPTHGFDLISDAMAHVISDVTNVLNGEPRPGPEWVWQQTHPPTKGWNFNPPYYWHNFEIPDNFSLYTAVIYRLQQS